MGKAFVIDDKTKQTLGIITNLLATPSTISIKHSDIKEIMGQQGLVVISLGSGTGNGRVIKAYQDALTNPWKEAVTKQAAYP